MNLSRRRFLQLSAAGAASIPALGYAGKKKHKEDPDAAKITSPKKIKDGETTPAKDPYGITNGTADLPDWDGSDSSESKPGSMRMFRGNLTHTYYGSGKVPDKPELVWKFRMSDLKTTLRGEPKTWSGSGWTGQTLKVGDYVFVGSTGGHMHCFEALTGKLVWVYAAKRMIKGSPCFYKNRIYFPNVDNHLRCLDASTGKLVWDWAGQHDMDSSPRIYNGLLYVGGEDGDVKCFDPETGDEKWHVSYGVGEGEKPGSGGIECSLAIADGIAYFGHLDGHVRALKLSDQSTVWKTEHLGVDIDASCLIVDDKLYVGVEEGKPTFHCIDRDTGEDVWTKHIPSGVWSTAAKWNDTLIVGGNNGKLYCLDLKTGDEKWTYKAGAAIWSSPSVVDGKVLFGDYDKYYRMVDAESGEELWTYDVKDRTHSGAAIEDGHIWVGSESGWYYCFG
jgi:outer membrane protein assembly factor BamB